MIDETRLTGIIALQYFESHPNLTLDEAVQDVNRNLMQDPAARRALLAIAAEIWRIGYLDGRPQPLTVAQKCDIAQAAFKQDGSYNVMQIIEQTQRLLLEQYGERRT